MDVFNCIIWGLADRAGKTTHERLEHCADSSTDFRAGQSDGYDYDDGLLWSRGSDGAYILLFSREKMVVSAGAVPSAFLDQCLFAWESVLSGQAVWNGTGDCTAGICALCPWADLAVSGETGGTQQGISVFLLCVLSGTYRGSGLAVCPLVKMASRIGVNRENAKNDENIPIFYCLTNKNGRKNVEFWIKYLYKMEKADIMVVVLSNKGESS